MVILYFILTLYISIAYGEPVCFDKILFGVASASYQIEGAWNISGKGESIWDRYTHEYPDRIFDHTNADVTADSYHLYKEDVKLLKELGVEFYRFSISWPRVLPTGLSNDINPDGIRYYNGLIEELKANNISAIVTMYHWDLPQYLQDLGGWTNPMIVDYFVDYARVLFDNFGAKVPVWLTFNEPLSFCEGGYGGMDAPGGQSSGFEDYLCGHNVLRAHAKVYHMFKNDYSSKFNAKIGITLDFAWFEAATTNPKDLIAAERARQFDFGWFAHPIFSSTGDYPLVMRQRIDAMSKRQNFSRSRLPTFTEEEVIALRGSADFMGLNHYTTYLASSYSKQIGPKPSYWDDQYVDINQRSDWPKSNSTWLKVVPWGFRKALNWIKNNYGNPPVFVTENGVSTTAGLDDKKRVQYIDSYLRSLYTAITTDGCNVHGYTYWSLTDNFEWLRGLSERFGLYEVDYQSPKKTRTARLSAKYYKQVVKTGCLPNLWSDDWNY